MSEFTKLVTCGLVGVIVSALTKVDVWAAEMDDYQRSFDSYRAAYSVFEVNRADFNQSQTFAAEENLVNSAKNMLVFRADSWSDYWKLVYSRFTTVSSASDDVKANWKSFFDTQTAWLSNHKDAVMRQKTRDGLLEVAHQLDAQKESYLSQAFGLNVEVVSGRLADAINQVRELNQTLLKKASMQISDASKREAIITGLNSNLERLNQLEYDMAVIKQDFVDESTFADTNRFSTIGEDFKPLYQRLTQLMAVTRELSGSVQW